MKWKESVDDSTKFIDGDFIPAVLVQNKIDLIDEEARKDDEEIKKFAEENKFIGYFRTSVKEGIGVEECMDFLIGNILERIEKCSKEGNSNPLEKDVLGQPFLPSGALHDFGRTHAGRYGNRHNDGSLELS